MNSGLLFPAFAIIVMAAAALCLVAYILARQYRVLKERQWRHEETMTALRQGIPADLAEKEDMTTTKPSTHHIEFGTDLRAELFWMRATSAFLGILGIFVGVGLLAAYRISMDPGTSILWPMGLIPMFGGAGMLVLYLILTYGFKRDIERYSKRERSPSNTEEDSSGS